MLQRCRAAAAMLILVALSEGCAHYEYDIVQPPNLAHHVGENHDVSFNRGALLYRLRSYQNHLVIQLQNETSQPIQLLGGRSFVVDPDGQSHPVDEETIAPESFIKLVLPPIAPEVTPVGPVIGIGLGVSSVHGPGYDLSFENPLFVRPRYYASADVENRFWKWEGETDVRLSLTFGHAGSAEAPFAQAFVFHRHKI